jgi:hypothetical protein
LTFAYIKYSGHVLIEKKLPIPSSRVAYDGKLNTGTGVTLTPFTSTHTRTSSIRNSLSNDITIKKPTHSRTSSTVSAADFTPTDTIHTPSFASLQTISTTTVITPAAPPVVNKKLYRQSAGPRLTQVKANIGLPRVRTSSITQQKEQQQQHQKSLISSTTPPTSSKTASPSSISSRQSHIPLPPLHSSTAATASAATTPTSSSTTSANNNVTSPDSSKKSLLKPPTQRGPGSTLRLRSMLAKRGQIPPPSKSPAK